MNDEIKQQSNKKETWKRALFMLLFMFFLGIVKFLVLMMAFFQFGFVVFTGQANARLLRLGHQLAAYAYQIISFLTFISEQRPFPFSTWPSEADDSDKSVNKENDGNSDKSVNKENDG
jgi:hypothetical protein